MDKIVIWDLLFIAVYVAGILLFGMRYRHSDSKERYFLANRSMWWPAIGFSMFAGSISCSTVVGRAGDAYATGIAVFNYDLISVFVMVFFAWFLLPLYIRSKIFTIPEFLERRFGVGPRCYFSVVTILINIFLDAAGSLYAAALVLHLIFPGVDISWLVTAFGLIVAAYVIPGGLSAAFRVDVVQGIFILIGASLLTAVVASKGGAAYIADLWAQNDIMVKLVRPLSDSSVPWLGMIVGIPVLGFFFWGNNQQIVQRALAANSVDQARKGVLFVGALTLITLFVLVIPGVMAHRFLPGLPYGDMVYPQLVLTMLPSGIIGLLLAVLIASLTSSLSGLLNSVSTLFTMDFYSRIRPHASGREMVRVGRLASVAALVIAIFWAPEIGRRFDSLIKYYQEIISLVAPPIVAAFLLGIFWRRINLPGVFTGLMAGAALSGANLWYKISTGVSFFGDIHFLMTIPYYLFFSAAVMIVVSYCTPAPDYAKIGRYVWTAESFRAENADLSHTVWWCNYRFWSYALLVAAIFLLVLFW
ncbi:MAG: sodium/solute symporter [Alistipes sp.]|nr:sodium/solute symporter [Alistipes sp.]